MKNLYLKIITISLSIFIFGHQKGIASSSLSASGKRGELISLIDNELKEVIRLNRQTNLKNPNLLLRMAELFLEKARVIKDDENIRFLTLSPKQRRRTRKRNFFKRSRKYFLQAQKSAKLILKRFRGYDKTGEVYYIMAFNEREFGREERAKYYFVKAVKTSKRGSEGRRKSKLALAEMLFNKRKYKEARPLYASSLRQKKDKWWTKDAMNYAWCLYFLKRESRALSIMHEVYRLSQNSHYIDVSESAKRDIGRFYSGTGRIREAVSFYKRVGGDIGKNLISVGKFLLEQGKTASAEKVFREAENYTKNDAEKIDALINQLVLYEKFGRIQRHMRVASKLTEFLVQKKLNEEQSEVLAYQIKKNSALLQNQVVGKSYRSQSKIRRKKAANAIGYFLLLKKIEYQKAYIHDFNIAETYYVTGQYSKAVPYYNDAFLGASKKNNRKIGRLALSGLTECIGKKGINPSLKKKYLIPVYIYNLNENPRSKKAFKIYQRLFSLYMKKGNISGAENTLLKFKQYFPKSVFKQEVMLAKIMDYHKKKGDKKQMRKWANRIKNGEFIVTRKYLKKLKLLLLTMQFEGVEKANSMGDKKLALKGYIAIYKDPEASQNAKRNAAYNIAVLFHELGDARRTYSWAERALFEMKPKEVRKFSSSFLIMSGDLFNQQYFKKSADLYQKVFLKLCKMNIKSKKTFFKNSMIINLAINDLHQAKRLIGKAYSCNINSNMLIEGEIDILKAQGELGYWNEFEDNLSKLEKSKKLWPKLIYYINKLKMAHIKSGNDSYSHLLDAKMMRFYQYSRKKRIFIPLSSLDIIAEIKLAKTEKIVDQLQRASLSFPEKTFGRLLKKKFDLLDRLTSKVLEVLEIRSGKGIVSSYKILVDNYKRLIVEVENFRPPQKSDKYIRSFKVGMRNKVISPLKGKINDFKREAKKQILTSQILSTDNNLFLRRLDFPFDLKYIPTHKGVIMDRGGRR